MNEDPNAVPGATPVVPTPVADEPVVPATPATEVPGEVSGEVPAGAPVEPVVEEEEKSEDAPVAPAV